jgi:hypothetical protein
MAHIQTSPAQCLSSTPPIFPGLAGDLGFFGVDDKHSTFLRQIENGSNHLKFISLSSMADPDFIYTPIFVPYLLYFLYFLYFLHPPASSLQPTA